MTTIQTLADPDLYATETVAEWNLDNGADDLRTPKRHMIADRIGVHIGGLEDGSHLLRLCGVEFILWVDHAQAYGDDNQPVPDFQTTDFDLRMVTGPNALLECDPISVKATAPYQTGHDGNYLPLTTTAARIAELLVAHTARKAVA